MALDPREYTQLKAFRDLIKRTVDRLGAATSQGTLSQAVGELAPAWESVDPAFAKALRDVGDSVWSMSFAQVRPTVQKITGHLGGQLAELDDQLANG